MALGGIYLSFAPLSNKFSFIPLARFFMINLLKLTVFSKLKAYQILYFPLYYFNNH